MSEILFVTHKYPPSIGGMERQSYELIQGIKKTLKTHVIAYDKDKESVWSFYFKLKSRIKKKLARHPDISTIHCNDGTVAAMCSWLVRDTNRHITATLHGLDVVFPNSYFQNSVIPKIRQFDMIFAVSQATAQACIDRGFDKNRIAVVPNGVDRDIAEIPQNPDILTWLQQEKSIYLHGKRIIVTVGRTVKRKGFSWFATKVVPRLSNDVVFVMIGPFSPKAGSVEQIISWLPDQMANQIDLLFGNPSDQKNIRAILSDPKYKDRVYQTGKLPFQKMMQLVGAADIFVMPNLEEPGDFEGFGLVALEACLRSTVVCAANIQGITDAIHNQCNGIMLPSADSDAWVKNIDELLRLPKAELEHMGQEYSRYAQRTFSWDKMANQYAEIFSELMNSNGSSATMSED